jgi:hypothetical protein
VTQGVSAAMMERLFMSTSNSEMSSYNNNKDNPSSDGPCLFECIVILVIGFYSASFFANAIL